MTLEPGICGVCGCTDEQACPGGCVWANATATLCSQCVGAAGQIVDTGCLIEELDLLDDEQALFGGQLE